MFLSHRVAKMFRVPPEPEETALPSADMLEVVMLLAVTL
jgi:hypothetical protein